MRIFSAQPYLTFGRDLNAALVEMGHDVVFKSDEYSGLGGHPTRKERKEYDEKMKMEVPGINKRWIEEVEKAHKKKTVDLFISGTDNLITHPETIEMIKGLGIPTLNIAHDDIPEGVFTEQCQDLALAFDYNWTFQLGAIKSYKKIGANVIHALGGANPHLFKPHNCKREFDVIFVGRNKGYRRKILQTIVHKGIDARAWGDGWRNLNMTIGIDLIEIRASQEKVSTSIDLFWSELVWHTRHFTKLNNIFGPYVSTDEMIKLFSQSKIILNFPGYFEVNNADINVDIDKAVKGIKGRDFEAPMSGAFYLTEYSDEIAQMYEIGKEIETFRSIPELVDKIKYYLENPNEAESIRKAGRQRALRDYTWVKSLEKVFNEMDLVD